MDAVIKVAVKEELRRQVTQSQEQTQPITVSERQNPAGNGLSNRTVTRLSGLLDRVRSGSKTSSNGKKRKSIVSSFVGSITMASQKHSKLFAKRTVEGIVLSPITHRQHHISRT